MPYSARTSREQTASSAVGGGPLGLGVLWTSGNHRGLDVIDQCSEWCVLNRERLRRLAAIDI